MKIKKMLKMYRRDFHADYECEFCGHVEKNKSGYDDSNFHNNVIPAMICPKCGKHGEAASSAPESPDYVVK